MAKDIARQVIKTGDSFTVIMQIADLHFGIKSNDQEFARARKIYINEFLNGYSTFLKRFPNFAPDILVVCGDIVWDGTKSDQQQQEYLFAETEFFLPFFEINELHNKKLSPNDVVLCLGNHDLCSEGTAFHKRENLWYDNTGKTPLRRPNPNCSFSEYLDIELPIEERYHRFENFENFCRKMGFASLCSTSKYN